MGIELIYFDIHGRGFMPRLVLAAAGIKFTDTRVTFAQLAEMKKSKYFTNLQNFDQPFFSFANGSDPGSQDR